MDSALYYCPSGAILVVVPKSFSARQSSCCPLNWDLVGKKKIIVQDTLNFVESENQKAFTMHSEVSLVFCTSASYLVGERQVQ